MTDRIELLKQTIASVERFKIPVCRISADTGYVAPNATLYIAMVETLKRRKPPIRPELIICDECHSAAFNAIFEMWPDARVIGATATPIGKHIYKYYTNMVSCIDTPELVELGFLTPCKTFQMQDDLSDLEKGNNGEFTDRSLFTHYNKSKLYEGVVTSWLERTPGTQTICFNVNVAHTIKMTEAFNSLGIQSRCIHSKTPETERLWVMKEFERGAFPVLNNCGILTRGYSHDPIRTIILNRATTSTALYLQMIGRGSRIFPGKKFFTVLDFGLNTTRHGLWQSPRTWSLEPPKKKKTIGAAPVKTCDKCEAMVSASARVCEFCGFIFLPTEKELAQGKLVEITNDVRRGIEGRRVSELSVAELIECERAGSLKATYVWRCLRARGESVLREYAAVKQYKDTWLFRQVEEMEMGNTEFFDKKIGKVPQVV